MDFTGYHRFENPETGERYGSFQVFLDDADFAKLPRHRYRDYDIEGNPVKPGWYWWACFPGCLPDGDAIGPFATPKDAYYDAINAG